MGKLFRPAAQPPLAVKRAFFICILFAAGCRIPDWVEIKNLYRVTRYLSAARFDKEFDLRRQQAINAVDKKLSAAAQARWVALQTAVWDFTSFHQSFYEVTLDQGETDIWTKPFEFLESKTGQKLARSLDIYYAQGYVLWRDYKEQDIPPRRRQLIEELYFTGFDLGLEEDIARLISPLLTEAEYKVKYGRAADAEDEDFKELSEKNLRKELQRVRKLDRTRALDKNELRDMAIRLSLLTEEDIAAVIREQAKPENTDMGHIERIAIAESMAFQIEDFLAESPAAKPGKAEFTE
ncbi:MAG: hypothetical protein KF713_08015 [Turneriella sp.]|nr:hypothetical protein [Turneriella sp.]